jgi:hypothetical protein
MSNYRPGYDPSDIERTILQEEIRRRGLHQSPFPLGRDSQPPAPIVPTGGPANDYAQHLSMLQRQQQPTGPPGGYGGYGAHSAYGRNPYAAVNPSGPLAQMYAVQQERQRQQQQAAVAAAAAAVGWNGSSPYGATAAQQPPPGLEHHHHYSSSPYGLTVQPHAPPPLYGRESSYGSVVSSSAGVSPSAHDAALMAVHPQQRPTPSPPNSSTHAIFSSANRNSTGSGGKSSHLEARMGLVATPAIGVGGKVGTQLSDSKFSADEDGSQYGEKGFMNDASQRTNESGVDNIASATETPVKGRLSSSPQASGSSGKKSFSSTSTASKDKSTPTSASKARVIIVDGVTIIEDGDDRWFTGSVPLGLDDDKYWLSELQVYLRSHFAEAFGATEDDIAAPMHGRNKPIALGQVGIRCMHCKRKCVFGLEHDFYCFLFFCISFLSMIFSG